MDTIYIYIYIYIALLIRLGRGSLVPGTKVNAEQKANQAGPAGSEGCPSHQEIPKGDVKTERRIFKGRSFVFFTLWLFNMEMENGPFIDGLPIKNLVI